MPQFTYIGRSRGGKELNGEIFAESKTEAIEQLRKQQVLVTKVEQKEEGKKLFGAASVKMKEIAVMTRQLSFMIDAGLPINQSLEILSSQAENKTLKKVLFEVRTAVEGGLSLSDALAEHPKVFTELYVNMVAAGESGGILDVILERLAVYMEKLVKLNRAVKSALVYPAAVVIIAVLVVFVILWKVIPTFAELFTGLGASLPAPTQITIAISEFIGNYILYIIGTIVGLIAAFRWYASTKKGRYNIDRVMLRLPIFGAVLKKIAVGRFCRTLGTLISSGVPILESLEITAKTSGNKIIEEEVMEAREAVETGKTLSEPMRDSAVFPMMVVQMVNVGEQTGELDSMVNKVADFYEDEVDAAIADLLSLLEPLIILFLGGTVGWIVVSMYLPIFALISEIM
jgi:type IV pilus assembly protein PilC